jgi:NTE family protein
MSKKTTSSEKKITNLALQGGGAHGAFTWGVLDRLLDEENLEIEAICATSAGAMNAIIFTQGLINNGRKGAQELLETFWKKVSNIASFSGLMPTMFDKLIDNKKLSFSPTFMAAEYFTRLISPYQYNFFDYNPLKDIIDELVDFKKVKKSAKNKLFINATNVKSGKIKVFECTEGLNVDHIMASACIPFLYKAVEIDGESYWDGGYSGNPALFPIFYKCKSSDIILIQVNPINIKEVPTLAPDIMDRINEISFNSTLMREMRAIAFVKKLRSENKISEEKYRDMNIHIIEAEEVISSLGANSKLNADWDFLTYLRDLGRQTADEWLKKNFDKVNLESSADLYEAFL